MSAITLYSIANVLGCTAACAHVERVPAEVIRFPRAAAVTRNWTVQVDEKGQRRLVAKWASTHGNLNARGR